MIYMYSTTDQSGFREVVLSVSVSPNCGQLRVCVPPLPTRAATSTSRFSEPEKAEVRQQSYLIHETAYYFLTNEQYCTIF
jgi:hypothetical protein